MALYGLAVYGTQTYGAPLTSAYTVQGLAATQDDFGRITVAWTSPPLADWSQLILVRSGYGFPIAASDGVLLATWDTTGTPQSYTDLDLAPGYWYYTLFIAAPFASWSAAVTYGPGDQVAYSDQTWMCIAAYALDVTPGSDDTVWIASSEIVQYTPAGSVASLAVTDHGYGAMLYTQMPAAYKQAPASSTDTGPDNTDLASFLNVLGFGFSTVATELDDLVAAYDVTTTRQDRLYAISQMLGITNEMGASARFQRLRALHAARINQQRGTQTGLTDLISSATGLNVEVSTGYNQMLSQDQSAFVDPLPPDWSAAATYQTGQQVLYQGVRYTCIGSSELVDAATYLDQEVSGSPNALTTVSLGGVAQIKEAATAAASISIQFVVTTPGSFYAVIALDCGPDCGILAASIDSSAVMLAAQPSVLPTTFSYIPPAPDLFTSALDTFAPAFAAFATVYTSPVPLTAGAYTLTLSCAAKNAASTGFSIAVGQVVLTATLPVFGTGAPPPSDTAEWSAAEDFSTSSLYFNPATGGQDTWSVINGTASLATGNLGG